MPAYTNARSWSLTQQRAPPTAVLLAELNKDSGARCELPRVSSQNLIRRNRKRHSSRKSQTQREQVPTPDGQEWQSRRFRFLG